MTDEERADSLIKLHGLPFALAASLGKQEDLKEARAFLYEGITSALRSARAEGFGAGVKAARHAVATAPAELYPDKTTEEAQIKAAIEMGAVGASGYFHERALMTALTWHIAAIDAITPPQEIA